MPYYKWAFRALRELPGCEPLAARLEALLIAGNGEDGAEQTTELIERTAEETVAELERQELTRAVCGDLEKHAYSVNDGVQDGEVRNLHILCTVR